MSRKKYENIEALKAKCDEYMNTAELVAPASFRDYIDLTPANVNSYKNTNPEYFELIKTYERKILAKIEEYAIYGQAHPDIASRLIRVSEVKKYYKDGQIKEDGQAVAVVGKFNQVGAMFILKSWQRDFYGDNVPIEQQDKVIIKIGTTKTEDNQLPFDIEKPAEPIEGQLRLEYKKG